MHLWGDGMSLGLVYKNGEHIFDEVCGEVPFLTYPLFEKTGVVKSAFRQGSAEWAKAVMSRWTLVWQRGWQRCRHGKFSEDRICNRNKLSRYGLVTPNTYGKCACVTEEDKGKGIVRERDYTDVDGLVTNVPGICLVTSYADCVPLYFVDPIKKSSVLVIRDGGELSER